MTVGYRVGSETEAPVLKLLPGVSISGQVRLPGRVPFPGYGVDAEVLDEGATTIYPIDADLLWWPDGTIAPIEHHTRTDAQGRYQVRGLPPKHCIVKIAHWHRSTIVHAGQLSVTVRAPATDVDFDLDVSKLTIRAECEGRPVEHAHIGMRFGGLLLKGGSKGGTSELLIRRGADYRILITAEGFAPAEVSHTAGPVDATRIVEMRRRETRTVHIRLTGASIARARFRWRPEDNSKEDALRLDRDLEPDTEGRFVFRYVPPGPYILEIQRPRAPHQHFHATFVEHRQKVVIGAGTEPLELPVTMTQGGRLRLKVTDRRGNFLAGTCEIRSAAHGKVPMLFQVGGDGGYVTGKVDEILPRGINEAASPLLPGRYDVKVDVKDCPTQSLHITIEPGEITERSLQFTPQ